MKNMWSDEERKKFKELENDGDTFPVGESKQNKMKKITYKKPLENLNEGISKLPNVLKEDGNIFIMSDGNIKAKIKWEGTLTEGEAIVLKHYSEDKVNIEEAKIFHLMGYKSKNTLGNLNNQERLTENKVIFDLLDKSKDTKKKI